MTETPTTVEQLASTVPVPGWVVGILLIILGGIWAVNKSALGILWADTLRSHIPWLSSNGNEPSQQRQADVTKASGDSVDVSGSTSLEQNSSQGTQSSEADITVKGADDVRSETRQEQGDPDSSDESSELLPDGGTTPADQPTQKAGLGDFFSRDTSESENQQQQRAEADANYDNRNAVNMEVDELHQYSSANDSDPSENSEGTIDFNYHPHSADPSESIDRRASRKNQFPIYGLDGEAHIDASIDVSVPEHWIEVVVPTDCCDVDLRDGEKVEIDNDSQPPRFKPEPGASGIAVCIVVYSEEDQLEYHLQVRPVSDANIDPPNENYLTLTIVRRG